MQIKKTDPQLIPKLIFHMFGWERDCSKNEDDQLLHWSTVFLFWTTRWFSTKKSLFFQQLGFTAAVATFSQLAALLPFHAADVVPNRSRKSFVFWQCEEGGAAGWPLVCEFQLPFFDWPRQSNGAESRQCRVSPKPPTTPPSPTPLCASASPYTPLFPCADCHTVFTTSWNVTHIRDCLLESGSDKPGILQTRTLRLGYLGTRCGAFLPFCHDSGFVYAFVRAGHYVLCYGR